MKTTTPVKPELIKAAALATAGAQGNEFWAEVDQRLQDELAQKEPPVEPRFEKGAPKRP